MKRKSVTYTAHVLLKTVGAPNMMSVYQVKRGSVVSREAEIEPKPSEAPIVLNYFSVVFLCNITIAMFHCQKQQK